MNATSSAVDTAISACLDNMRTFLLGTVGGSGGRWPQDMLEHVYVAMDERVRYLKDAELQGMLEYEALVRIALLHLALYPSQSEEALPILATRVVEETSMAMSHLLSISFNEESHWIFLSSVHRCCTMLRELLH